MIKFQFHKLENFKLVYFELQESKVDHKQVFAQISAACEPWNGPEVVLFRGHGPVWLYSMLVHVAHATPNVATFEPRLNGYVVVSRHGGVYEEGDVIPTFIVGMTVVNSPDVESRMKQRLVGGADMLTFDQSRSLVIAVGGPPHSGKSIFLASLYRHLLARIPAGVFLQRGCPDGDSMAFNESDPLIAAQIRLKGEFTKDFCESVVNSIQGLKKGFAITILDLGGKRISPNEELIRNSTHLVVLSSKEEETRAWVEYAQQVYETMPVEERVPEEQRCKILAVFASKLVRRSPLEGGEPELDLEARSSIEIGSSLPITGTMVNLDRDRANEVCHRDAISAFADRLASMVAPNLGA